MSQLLRSNPFEQDPNEELDYIVDWSDQLDLGDTITGTATWTVSPSGLTIGTGGHAPSNTTTTTTVWLKLGTSGIDYEVEVTFTTTGGRTLQGHIVVMVRG